MAGIFVCLALSLFSVGTAQIVAAPQVATRTVNAEVRIASRTTLIVSNQVLQFSVPFPGPPAVSTVDFVAGVRTHTAGEVVLTIEAYAAEPRLQDARGKAVGD